MLKRLFEGQLFHLALTLVLLVLARMALGLPGIARGSLWGVGTEAWYWASALLCVIHVTYVWFCWRTELHLGLLSRLLGRAAFPLYAVPFFLFLIGRPILVSLVSISNRGSLAMPTAAAWALAAGFAAPSLWALWSVDRYFGFRRAAGIDHFDRAWRSAPLVRKGSFRFVPNSMYTLGFLALYIPGLLLQSGAGLAAALFQHLYIWGHYYGTEKPDMRRIYGGEGGP